MRISICMPVKGEASWLVPAVCSILLQEHEDVELIIKDGDVSRRDPRLERVFSLLQVDYAAGADGGIFPAVNDCLRRARGDILYFMCADDLLCPGALTAVNEAFERERFGGPYWVYGQTVSADAAGRTLGVDGALTTLDAMLAHNRLGQPAVFWNRAMMERAGMFDTRYRWAADYDLWLRFWQQRPPEYVGQTLGVFRHHGDNSSQVNAAATDREAAKISARHRTLGGIMERARNTQLARKSYAAPLESSSTLRGII